MKQYGGKKLLFFSSKKAIIAVPNRLIISIKKVQNGPLKKLIQENPQLFDEDVSNDAEFNILAVFIMYEKMKQEKSFYKPYLDLVQQQFTLFEWTNKQLQTIDDRSLLDEFHELEQEMEKAWIIVKNVLSRYPQLFDGETINETHKDIFYWSYEFVMTRCFGWSLPSTSLVPFADMLNHSNDATTHYLVHRKLEKLQKNGNRKEIHQQYIPKKHKLDLRVFQDEGIQQNQNLLKKIHFHEDKKLAYVKKNKSLLYSFQKKKLERFEQKEVDLTHEDLREMINAINWNVLSVWKEKEIWELDFETSSDSEDNDSDDEENEIREKQLKSIHESELEELKNPSKDNKNQMSKFIERLKLKVVVQDKRKEQIQRLMDSAESTQSEQKMEQTVEPDQNGEVNKNKEKNENKEMEDKQVNQEQNEEKNEEKNEAKDKEEDEEKKKEQSEEEDQCIVYESQDHNGIQIQNQVVKKLIEDEQEEDSEKDSDSKNSETEWDWFDEDDDDIYFVITTTREVYEGEQIYTCYGRRTNKFLLLWYGFTFDQNQYDSFNFRLWMNLNPMPFSDEIFKDIVIQDFIRREDWQKGYLGNKQIKMDELSKEFRVKSTHICEELIMYLRIFLLIHYNGEDGDKLLITIPKSLEFEIFVLQFALRLYNYLLTRFKTSPTADQKVLQNEKIASSLRFSTILNLSNKKILLSQIIITLDLIKMLQMIKQQGLTLKQAYMNSYDYTDDFHSIMQRCRPLKNYLKLLSIGLQP